MKKYSSKSHVAVNVILPNGVHVHVAFEPLTGGGSVYYTNDENLQKALERHYQYGKLYKGAEVEEPKEEEPVVEEPAAASKKVSMASLEDAKEYLIDRFGISRTKLRSKKQIMDAAEAHNIEFEGI